MEHDKTFRQKTEDRITDVLNYLQGFGVMDPSVKKGEKTTRDIAQSFSGTPDSIGLLDFTTLGSFYAGQEGKRELEKLIPDDKQRGAFYTFAMTQGPTLAGMTIADLINNKGEDISKFGLPMLDMQLGVAEGVPMTAVALRPLRNFLKSLKTKIKPTETTTTDNVDLSKRKLFGNIRDIGVATGVLGASGMVPDMIKGAKVTKTIPPIKEIEKLNFTDLDAFDQVRNLSAIADEIKFQPLGGFAKSRIEQFQFKKTPENPIDTGKNTRLLAYRDEIIAKDNAEHLAILADELDFMKNRDMPDDYISMKDLINKNDKYQQTESILDNPSYTNLEDSITGKMYKEEKDIDGDIQSFSEVINYLLDKNVDESPYFKELMKKKYGDDIPKIEYREL